MTDHLAEFVYALSGRDKGKCFVVLSQKDNYLYLCDGKRRKAQKPKCKKIKHVRLTGDYDESLRKILADVGRLTNKEVRFALKAYRASNPDCL